MTTTPKNSLIILILGITIHLNLGNTSAKAANYAVNYNKISLLNHWYSHNFEIVDFHQQLSFMENSSIELKELKSKNKSHLKATSLNENN